MSASKEHRRATGTARGIAEIKEYLRQDDLLKAELRCLRLLFDQSTSTRWEMGESDAVRILTYVSKIEFNNKVPTAQVEYLRTKKVLLGPRFFLKYIDDIEDLLGILYHERNHPLIRLLIYPAIAGEEGSPDSRHGKKLPHNIIDDILDNSLVRRVVYTNVFERFYIDNKGVVEEVTKPMDKWWMPLLTYRTDLVRESLEKVSEHIRNYLKPHQWEDWLDETIDKLLALHYGLYEVARKGLYHQVKVDNNKRLREFLHAMRCGGEPKPLTGKYTPRDMMMMIEQFATQSHSKNLSALRRLISVLIDLLKEANANKKEQEPSKEKEDTTSSKAPGCGGPGGPDDEEDDTPAPPPQDMPDIGDDDSDAQGPHHEKSKSESEESEEKHGSEDEGSGEGSGSEDDEKAEEGSGSAEDESESESSETGSGSQEQEDSDESDEKGSGEGEKDDKEFLDDDFEKAPQIGGNLSEKDVAETAKDNGTVTKETVQVIPESGRGYNEGSPVTLTHKVISGTNPLKEHFNRILNEIESTSDWGDQTDLLKHWYGSEDPAEKAKMGKYASKMNDLAGELISSNPTEIWDERKQLETPDKLTKRDLYFLSEGYTPPMYSTKVFLDRTQYKLYSDVSGSMEQYLALLPDFVRALRHLMDEYFQFSGVVVSAPICQDFREVLTNGCTNYTAVADHILRQGYSKVIVFTDNEGYVEPELAEQLRHKLKAGELELNLILVKSASIKGGGLIPFATRILKLYVEEPKQQSKG